MSCLVIIAHAGAKPTLEEFWPVWRRLNVPIVVFLPDQDAWPIANQPDHLFNFGESAHRGSKAFNRFLHACATSLLLPFDGFCIIEPDCLPLQNELPEIVPNNLAGWPCRITGGKESFELSILPPWTVDRPALSRLVDYLRASGDADREHDDCCGLTDRWLIKVALMAGVQVEALKSSMGYVWLENILDSIRESKPAWVHGFKRKAELKDLWPT